MSHRIPATDLLCVYCPAPIRQHLERGLRALHPTATVTCSTEGWLIVESSLGAPRSALIGGTLPIRFALGECALLGGEPHRMRAADLARMAVESAPELAGLPGDFCFVALQEQGCASAVRSCSGLPRLFGFYEAGITAIGTRLEWVARVRPTALRLDVRRLVCDDHALGISPDHGSAVSGITIVPVGHVARFGRWRTPRLERYWSPPTTPLRLTANEVAAEVSDLLKAELCRHLDPDHSNALLYSGGLDSSLVAAVAARANSSAVLDGVSILPPIGHPALTRERYYVRTLTSSFRRHVVHHLDPDWLFEAIADQPGTLCPVVSSEWQALSSLDVLPRTVISGWFADECFGHLRLPELFRTRMPPGIELRQACSLRDAASFWYRRRRAGRSPFQTDGLLPSPLFNPEASEQFVGWLRAVTWVERPERPAERLTLYRRLTDIGGAYAEAASAFDARAIAPFACRAVVELAARLDPLSLFEHRYAKAPLRRLAETVLPAAHARRSDKGDWGIAARTWPRPEIPAALAPVLDIDYLQAHPTLSLDEVGTLLWVAALERGRVRIEHDRKAIWDR